MKRAVAVVDTDLAIADLGERTLEVWRAIADYQRRMGYVPSYRDLMDMVGVASPSVVKYHVDRLMHAGVLWRPGGLGRTLVLLREPGTSRTRVAAAGKARDGS